MSVFTIIKTKWNYSIEYPQRGMVIYREGNCEYTFPAYEEEDCFVVVGVPSSQRIHLFFNSYAQQKNFSESDQLRIFTRIQEHFVRLGIQVRIFTQAGKDELSVGFYPELFQHRDCASELLDDAGYTLFRNFDSIDVLHEEYGLEITGIREEQMIKPILEAMRTGFPHWHHYTACLQDSDCERGWNLVVSMFPVEACSSGWYDEI